MNSDLVYWILVVVVAVPFVLGVVKGIIGGR